MKFTKLALVIFGGLVLGGIGAGLFLAQKKPNVSRAPLAKAPQELTTWTDPAGFSFKYPKELSVNKHDEDNENYAHLEFTKADHPGRIIIFMKDLPSGVTDTATWIKKIPQFSSANILDTTLGGSPAKKILLETPQKMILVGTVSDDVVTTVEATLSDRDYWSKVHDTITGSFSFGTKEQPTNRGTTSDEGESVDEEETVQ